MHASKYLGVQIFTDSCFREADIPISLEKGVFFATFSTDTHFGQRNILLKLYFSALFVDTISGINHCQDSLGS